MKEAGAQNNKIKTMQWLVTAVCLIWMIVVDLSWCLHSGGILYPRESPTREVKSLDGIWHFKLSKPDHFAGFRERWYHTDLIKTGKAIPMPVPSSYNDITTETEVHDHVGLVWYDRTFYVPDRWRAAGNRVWLRFGGVHYSCQVWINGHSVMSHEIGHLPFVQEVTSFLAYGTKNRITVVVDNTLLPNTIPQGQVEPIETLEGKKQQQTYNFDFFNYAGIQRSVHLYTTPTIYLDDITISTDIDEDRTTGIIRYNVSIEGLSGVTNPSIRVYADLINRDGVYISRSQPTFFNSISTQAHGIFRIKNVKLWWPYLMNEDPGYLYSIEFRVVNSNPQNSVEDIYTLPIGVRTLTWTNTTFLINNKPIYIRGFGRHEDSAIRGKGVDLPLITRDYNLIKWIGANAYRTSHYPYAEEIMDFADEQGIMIIDECPAVETTYLLKDGVKTEDLRKCHAKTLLQKDKIKRYFSDILMAKHKDSLKELIHRDKNRPSVIMWSVTNEPNSSDQKADAYFRSITHFVKTVDKSRPITAAINRWYSIERAKYHKLRKRIRSYEGYNSCNSSKLGNRQFVFLQVGLSCEECCLKKFARPFRSPKNWVKSLDPSDHHHVFHNLCIQAQYLDIIGFNRYIGWYSNPGKLSEIKRKVINEAHNWHNKHNKPIYMAEYGADSVGGINSLPAHLWAERYQVELIAEHFKAFDVLRNESFFIGEMVWNFADFETEQSVRRVNGNKKGLFTRDRQPKEAAYLVRKRYFQLAAELEDAAIPEDLDVYTISKPSPLKTNKIEL